MNEYLQQYQQRKGERRALVHSFSWAIPNEEALEVIAKYSPLVEMGAGTGYWAKLLSERGVEIVCYDKYVGETNPYKHYKHFFPINQGDEEALKTLPTTYNLFLCWPCYDDPFARNCLANFKGSNLVYIGEGDGGCTGDDAFHEALETGWKLVEEFEIPQWQGLHDRGYVYQSK